VGSPSRVDASLHALLQLAPIGLSAERAAAYHGHSPKRFLLNVVEASASLSPDTDGAEAGRFSGSTAQNTDLEPVAAMLRQHSLRSAQLPGIYAGKAKVEKVFDRMVAIQRVLVAATQRVDAGRSLPTEHAFSETFEGL